MTQITDALDKSYYYLSHNFGGGERFIDFLASTQSPLTIEERVHRILSHPSSIAVVSPWSYHLYLGTEENPAISSKPYSLFSLEGTLLYKVSNHNSIFGESILDKTLVLQSRSTDMYYLQYESFSDKETVLIIINNLALEVTSPIKDSDYLKAPEIEAKEPSDNYISISLPNINQDYVVSTVLLPSQPLGIKTAEEILNNPTSLRDNNYVSRSENLFVFFPKMSGWLTFSYRDINSIDSEFLYVKSITGAGDDRLIKVSEFVYYLAVGDEIEISLVRQQLGSTSRRPPGLSTSNNIKLAIELSNEEV